MSLPTRPLSHAVAQHLIARATGKQVVADHLFAENALDGDVVITDSGSPVTRKRTEKLVPPRDIARELSLVQVHNPLVCVGRGCSVHHPSEHHMRAWPMVWRSWHGYFERTCPHGIGHPDPDDMTYLKSVGREDGVHGCDGCCGP